MKKIYIALLCLFVTSISFAQALKPADKIKLANGQKIIVESTTTIEASLTMGMELNSNSTTVNALEVKSSTDKDYTISNTLTKLKVNMNMMGQANNYDSENKNGNNEEMSKVFDERLNKAVDVVVDNTNGIAVTDKKKTKSPEAEESNPADDLMRMFSDNSDDALVSGAFEIVPKGKSVGDSWSDTTKTKEMNTIRIYTLKSLTGTEATIQADVITTAVNKLNFQEMEFEVKSETKTKGEILSDINTALVKKRTTNAEITGSIQMMGQDMPISAKSTAIITYQ
ncbi:MAG: DUF6263 family protein [Ferruginibacter sp.]